MAEIEPTFLEVVQTSAQEMRTAYAGLQAGVWDGGDLKATSGAGLSVDVAAGVCFVSGGTVVDQGLYRGRNDAAINSSAFGLGGAPAAHATLPRLDQVVCRILDTTHDGFGERKWRLEWLAGTPTAGATLDNRSGAALISSSSVRVADVLVGAGATTIPAANIRDRRPWARGVNLHHLKDTVATITTTAFVVMDSAIPTRFECSGRPLALRFLSVPYSAAAATLILECFLDGVALGQERYLPCVAGVTYSSVVQWRVAPTAGSHIIDIRARVAAAGTAYSYNSTQYAGAVLLTEDMAPSASNA